MLELDELVELDVLVELDLPDELDELDVLVEPLGISEDVVPLLHAVKVKSIAADVTAHRIFFAIFISLPFL